MTTLVIVGLVLASYALAVRTNAFGLYGRDLRTVNRVTLAAAAVVTLTLCAAIRPTPSALAAACLLGLGLAVPLALWSRSDLRRKVADSAYVDPPRAVVGRFVLLLALGVLAWVASPIPAIRSAVRDGWLPLGLALAWGFVALFNLLAIRRYERRTGTRLVVRARQRGGSE